MPSTPPTAGCDSGWAAAPGIPAALIEGAIYRSLAVYGSGLLLSIALGVLAAVQIGRRIAQSIPQMGRGETAATDIREIPATWPPR